MLSIFTHKKGLRLINQPNKNEMKGGPREKNLTLACCLEYGRLSNILITNYGKSNYGDNELKAVLDEL